MLGSVSFAYDKNTLSSCSSVISGWPSFPSTSVDLRLSRRCRSAREANLRPSKFKTDPRGAGLPEAEPLLSPTKDPRDPTPDRVDCGGAGESSKAVAFDS